VSRTASKMNSKLASTSWLESTIPRETQRRLLDSYSESCQAILKTQVSTHADISSVFSMSLSTFTI
jgi:hypothetical protein